MRERGARAGRSLLRMRRRSSCPGGVGGGDAAIPEVRRVRRAVRPELPAPGGAWATPSGYPHVARQVAERPALGALEPPVSVAEAVSSLTIVDAFVRAGESPAPPLPALPSRFICSFPNCSANYNKAWKLDAHLCKHTGEVKRPETRPRRGLASPRGDQCHNSPRVQSARVGAQGRRPGFAGRGQLWHLGPRKRTVHALG